MHQLYFIRGEWPKNNISESDRGARPTGTSLAYYVIGGGIKTAIFQDNVAATNGIVHYIQRVLGVPYQSLWEILRNESRLQYALIRDYSQISVQDLLPYAGQSPVEVRLGSVAGTNAGAELHLLYTDKRRLGYGRLKWNRN